MKLNSEKLLRLILQSMPLTLSYILDSKDEDGCTLAHLAARGGYVESFVLLVEYSSDLSMRNNDGRTALGCFDRDSDALEVIPHLYLRLTYTKYNQIHSSATSDAMLSSKAKHRDLLERLQRDCVDGLELLLGRGADLNTRDEEGSTLAHRAAHRGHVCCLVWLLQDKSVDLSIRNNEGKPALELLVVTSGLLCTYAFSGEIEALQLLLDRIPHGHKTLNEKTAEVRLHSI